jgi:hypothetical protein
MKPSLLRFFFALLALTFFALQAQATHLRAGEITVRRDACNSLKFWITITVFTNTINTQVLFGGDDDILDFGDNSDPDGDGIPGILVPETENTLRPDLGEGIATASYTIGYTYAGPGNYTISYSEPNRNEGVVNMDQSVNTRFYLETKISVDPFFGCNTYTPVLEVPPIDRGCTGVAWFHNPGAYDLDGDSISYRMVVPNSMRATTVSNYRDPDDASFYTDYSHGNELGLDRPTFTIDPVKGNIVWDAPGSAGEYNIAFEIVEWRKSQTGLWVEMGLVRRDMQIIIEECENKRPELIIPADTCVVAGTVLEASIFGSDIDNDQVKLEAFSEILNLSALQSPATVEPEPAFRPQPSEMKFRWQTECAHVKEQPYQVVFKVTDDGRPNLVTFKTWLIRVVGPKPEIISASLVPGERSAQLEWEPYICQNAETMQVWRRVDSLAFDPGNCQTGMPPNLGYELIAEVPVVDANGSPVTSYLDTNGDQGLASGAVYCYRLVAIFPAPKGGDSYMSEEVCVGPIIADAAVITNVTIDRTTQSDGVITVKWLPPFEADPVQFPPPYTYKVFRAEGFTGESALAEVPDPDDADTEVVDTGLNTENKIYNYRVYSYASNGAPLDTSAVASSVRVEAQSQLNRIQLTWDASVPWSNVVPGFTHKVYRSDNNTTLPVDVSGMQLLSEVEVSSSGMTFVDGADVAAPLEGGRLYCYIIETLGSYGNEDPIFTALDPLRNFSQVICSTPGDTIPPCVPPNPIAHNAQNCEDYFTDDSIEPCSENIYSNTVVWSRSDSDCLKDVAYYLVYYSPSTVGNFEVLRDEDTNPIQVKDTFFIHQNLTSFAGCYKISAVDRSGNESELTEAICFDNCPYYELPNVFTPNGDECNEFFSAYSTKERYRRGETGGSHSSPYLCDGSISEANERKCARFVRKVKFVVYNRWGKEVYTYESGGENTTIYIDWDGRASDGSELATGVYYYMADVTFLSVDPAKQQKKIKGWVQIMRERTN